MSRYRPFTLLVLAAVVAGTISSAPARTARSQALGTDPRRAPAGSIRVTNEGGTTSVQTPPRKPSDLFGTPDARTKFTRETFLARERTALEKDFHITLPDPAAFADRIRKMRAAGKAIASDPTDTFSDTIIYPGGDLDGDGRQDLIVETQVIGFDNNTGDFVIVSDTIWGKRGFDGAVIWAIETHGVEAGFALPSGDLDRDGADDVLLVRFALDPIDGPDQCVLLACLVNATRTYHWTFAALSGRDAGTLWTNTLDGKVTATEIIAYGLLAFAGAEMVEETNAVVDIYPVKDAAGSAELLFDAYDGKFLVAEALAFALVAIAYGGIYDAQVATRADLRAGDGSVLLHRSAEYQPGGATMFPVGNAVGSNAEDLMWYSTNHFLSPFACAVVLIAGACLFYEHTDLTLEMIDGATLGTSWTEPFGQSDTEEAFIDPVHTDTNGDGHDDLFIAEYRGTSVTTALNQGIMDGSNGKTLWEKPTDAYFFPIGEAGGSPGADLAAFDLVFTDTIGVQVTRYDGANGNELLKTTRTYDSINLLDLIVYLPGDTDGDGATDIVFDALIDTFPNGVETLTSSAVDESGRTGGEIWSRTLTGFTGTAPAGDLEGDNGADLYDTVVDFDNAVTTVRAIRLPSGDAAWTRTDSFSPHGDGFAFGTLLDLTGDGKDDAFYLREEYGDTFYHTRYDFLSGADGSILWGDGDVMSGGGGGGGPAPGAIAGVVTDASGPLAGICVTVQGATNGTGTTNDAGAYLITSLAPGSYKVEFEDCTAFTHSTEWYNDKPDENQADPVTVSEGLTTSGIDSVLSLVPPPANDDIAGAITIGALPYLDLPNTAQATVEGGEPDGCGLTHTAWYKTSPSLPGVLRASADGRNPHAVGVYDGADPGHLTLVDCSQSVSFAALPGHTYWFQLGATGDAGSPAEFDLTSTP